MSRLGNCLFNSLAISVVFYLFYVIFCFVFVFVSIVHVFFSLSVFVCIRSDEGLTPETSALESLYSGVITLYYQDKTENLSCLFPPIMSFTCIHFSANQAANFFPNCFRCSLLSQLPSSGFAIFVLLFLIKLFLLELILYFPLSDQLLMNILAHLILLPKYFCGFICQF